jgi:hypothetical protein
LSSSAAAAASGPVSEVIRAVDACIAASFGSVGSVFVSRVEQSAANALDGVVAYQMAGLLAPYAGIVAKLTGGGGPLVDAMQQCGRAGVARWSRELTGGPGRVSTAPHCLRSGRVCCWSGCSACHRCARGLCM